MFQGASDGKEKAKNLVPTNKDLRIFQWCEMRDAKGKRMKE